MITPHAHTHTHTHTHALTHPLTTIIPFTPLDLAALTHRDDEYVWAGVEDPKVVVTTSHDPSSRLKQFAKVHYMNYTVDWVCS